MKCSNHEVVIDAIMELYHQDRMEMSVVHGPYSVGKTYIARALQARLGRVIPYICLDAWRMSPFIFDQLREN